MNQNHKDLLGKRKVLVAEGKSLLDEMRTKECDENSMKTKSERFADIEKEIAGLNSKIDIEVKASNFNEENKEDNEVVSLPGMDRGGEKKNADLGKIFTSSQQYKDNRNRHQPIFSMGADDYSVKAVITTTAGFAPRNIRETDIVPFANRVPRVLDYIPSIETDVDAVKFLEQTTFTNNAAGTAEGAAMTQSTFKATERSQPIELYSTYVTITQQQLEVAEFTEDTINNELLLAWRLNVEQDTLSGSGVSPILLGIYNKAGIGTYAKAGADTNIDAIYQAIYSVQNVGFANPTACMIHPANMKTIVLLKNANNNYIWGDPSMNPGVRIWGIDMVPTVAATSGTAVLGDWTTYSRMYMKKGLVLETGFINDDFQKNQYSIKATGRLAFVVKRAAAFATATNLN